MTHTIGVCGYGYTGSGAVFDYLKEFEECSFSKIEYEFMLPYIQHGIQDLEYQLTIRPTRFFSSDAAIKDYRRLVRMYDTPDSAFRKLSGKKFRELTDSFLDNITQIAWRGGTYEDRFLMNKFCRIIRYQFYARFVRLCERKLSRRLEMFWPEHTYLSIYPAEFEDKVRKYIRSLLISMQYDFNKNILLNQPFDVHAPASSMKYFDNPKAILVDRDPRDIYVLAKKYLYSLGEFIPTNKVDEYILYHRLIRKSSAGNTKYEILRIRYEDMIYDYEKTSNKVISFLGLASSKRVEKKYFDPMKSINNTQLYLRHPELAEDIKKIETELSEYLYPFDQYVSQPNGNVKPF